MEHDIEVGTAEINLKNESHDGSENGKSSNTTILVNIHGHVKKAEALAKTAAATMKILLEK